MDFREINDLYEQNKDFVNRYNDYSSKSEEELLKDLDNIVTKMKNDGSFDAQALESFYNMAGSFLSESQRERMRHIIDVIKG